MADDGAAGDAPITFNVKSSQDATYNVTVPLSYTVRQLKEKLAGEDFANIPPERQRLIYSGRALKDPETLASYKIKEGNTVHLVKGAASNERQNPANQGSTVGGQSGPANSAVPTNLSSGPGANNPLAGLTGARYAGLAHLPNQSMFGPDGGMGPPPDPEQIIQLLDNPQFASTLNEALSNPQIVEQMIQSNPMLREMGPAMRQMMQSPEYRRIITDPQMLRATMQAQRAFGGPLAGRGGNPAFPAPGATDTTPAGAQSSNGTEGQNQNQQQQQQQQQPMDPFAMFGGRAGNPFAQMFAPAAFGGAQGDNTNSGATGQRQQAGNPSTNQYPNPQFPPQMQSNLAAIQAAAVAAQQRAQANGGNTGAGATTGTPDASAQGQANSQQSAFSALASLMGMVDPSGGGGAGNANANAGAGANPYGFNPFAMFGGMGGDGGETAAPQDSRPPEERYAEQLRQLNDMGFYGFERNVEALRRSGGSVNGAVEYLLTHPS